MEKSRKKGLLQDGSRELERAAAGWKPGIGKGCCRMEAGNWKGLLQDGSRE
jgi:hypothetical protein